MCTLIFKSCDLLSGLGRTLDSTHLVVGYVCVCVQPASPLHMHCGVWMAANISELIFTIMFVAQGLVTKQHSGVRPALTLVSLHASLHFGSHSCSWNADSLEAFLKQRNIPYVSCLYLFTLLFEMQLKWVLNVGLFQRAAKLERGKKKLEKSSYF